MQICVVLKEERAHTRMRVARPTPRVGMCLRFECACVCVLVIDARWDIEISYMYLRETQGGRHKHAERECGMSAGMRTRD